MKNFEQFKEAIYPMLWDNGSYSFLHLEIKLKDTASKESLIREKEEASCFVTLTHEYIHYIQNFTTTWGFTNFITYIDFFTVFFGDNILLEKNPELPLKDGMIDKKFGKKKYSNYFKSAYLGIEKGSDGKFSFNDTNEPDFTIIESTLTDPYWEKEVYISYVAFKGKQIPLNELVVSENMAIVGSYLSSGLPIEESKQSIDIFWGPQYHIIYSFLNNLFPEKNCFKLTYIICESSLLIVPYNKIISRVLIFLRDNTDELKMENEDLIIDKILTHIDFDISLNKIIPNLLEQLNSRILTFNKYKENYEFFKYLLDILTIFKKGLNERLKVNHTYRDELNSEFLNYYSKIIYSPILVFADNQKTMLGEPSNDFVNSIASFHGIMKIFHLAYFGKINKCPFCEEYSICKVEKGLECENNSLEVYKIKKYKGCLMSNAINIIGIRRENRL